MARVALNSNQYQSILEAAHRIHSTENSRDFAVETFASVAQLIDADLYTIALFKAGRLIDHFNSSPTAFNSEELRCFTECPEINPIVSDVIRNGGNHPRRTSDFMTVRQFRDTEFYQECLRRNRFDHCLAAPFQIAGDFMVGISINRISDNFTTEEVSMLSFLRPHLDIAWQKLEKISNLESEVSELKAQLGDNTPVSHAHIRLRSLGLRRREAEVLRLLVDRMTNVEIGAQLGISARTVETHLVRIFEVLKVHNRRAAAEIAKCEMER